MLIHGFILARPSPPRNCSLKTSNNTEGDSNLLQVYCVAGYDGGLPQSFVLEALDPVTGKTRYTESVAESGECKTSRFNEDTDTIRSVLKHSTILLILDLSFRWYGFILVRRNTCIDRK